MDASHQFLYNSNMAGHDQRTRIENFNLFGEVGELPDIVHCETIETRSRVHNWEFKPHRHARLHQVLLLKGGGGQAKLDTQTAELQARSLLNVPAGCVHAFTFTKGTAGWVVTLSSELLDEVLHSDEGLGSVLSRPAVVRWNKRHRQLVEQIFDEHGERGFARAHVLRSLSSLLLGHVARTLQDLDYSHTDRGRASLWFRFERLLESHFDRHWSVADYARNLSVSPTHLSRVTRQATGLAASRIIEERIIREARRHLVFTNLGISEIAYLLGYDDPAYFSRVFSRATGMSPKSFRAQAEKG